MKIECSWTREDLKKYLIKKRQLSNIILFVLGILAFVYITILGFFSNDFDNWVLAIGFVCYILFLIVILYLITKIYVWMKLSRNDRKTKKAYGTYVIEVDKKGITSKFGKETISYQWKDINRKKFHKNYFYLATNEDSLGLYFRREVLKDDFERLKSYVQKRLS